MKDHTIFFVNILLFLIESDLVLREVSEDLHESHESGSILEENKKGNLLLDPKLRDVLIAKGGGGGGKISFLKAEAVYMKKKSTQHVNKVALYILSHVFPFFVSLSLFLSMYLISIYL
jgi:hypothetical protein